MIYASINSNKKVIDILNFDSVVKADNFISVPQYDDSIIGKFYNGTDFVDSLTPVTAPVVVENTPENTAATEKDTADIIADIDAFQKEESEFRAQMNAIQLVAQVGQIASDCANMLTIVSTALEHIGTVETLAADIKVLAETINGHFLTVPTPTAAPETAAPTVADATIGG